MSALTAAVIGARRARQGIGEFVARFLAAHGARVVAIAGTTEATVAEAREGLRARWGIEARGYTDVEALLEAERPDVLAICSPTQAHAAALEAAAERAARGAPVPHVLCDKPLLWAPGRDMAAAVRSVAGRLAARGRLLESITQWPCTLAAFRRLYPALGNGKPRRFRMSLSPTVRGPAMLVDSLPHPLSLLRALAGPGRPGRVAVAWEGDERATVRFDYERGAGTVDTEVRLERRVGQPRPAGYAIDGLEARREVRMEDYSMELVAPDGRRVPLEDPLGALVAGFLDRAASGARTDEDGLASDAAALKALVEEVTKQ